MFNRYELEKAYKGVGLSVPDFTQALGIVMHTWYRKMESKTDWKLSESQTILRLLREHGWEGEKDDIFPM